MIKTIFTSKRYWFSVLILGFIFVIAFSFIEHLMEFNSIGLDDFINKKISNGRWVRYVISRIVGGLFYGMIMAYFFEKRKEKTKK